MKKLLLTFLMLTAVIVCGAPKYVFLFIGDGMSSPQRNMAAAYSKEIGKGELLMNTFPVQAASRTSAANAVITDSAASATAIACGEKTNNGVVGLAADGKRKLESVAYVAKKSGKKVGIITSVNINHATPAGFYGHRISRGQYYMLGLDMVASGFDYFGGGGVISPDDRKNVEYQGNIYDLMEKAGYKVLKVKTEAEMAAVKPGIGKLYLRGSDGSLPYAIDNKGQSLKLADFVAKGIEVLDNDKGFFIMCEGGAIDWMGHGNDAATNILETIDLDEAIKVAYDFAQKHPEDTLIVITGDHETGGLTLGFANTGYQVKLANLFLQKQSSPKFDSYLKKAAAGKDKVVLDDLKAVITEFYGLQFTGEDADKQKEAGPMVVTKADEAQLAAVLEKKQLKDNAFHFAVLHLFNSKVGISWSTYGHSALPTITSAWGKHAERFGGKEYENTNIAVQLKAILTGK